MSSEGSIVWPGGGSFFYTVGRKNDGLPKRDFGAHLRCSPMEDEDGKATAGIASSAANFRSGDTDFNHTLLR